MTLPLGVVPQTDKIPGIGIGLALFPRDSEFSLEVQRAPDDGGGDPNVGAAVSIDIVPPSTRFLLDYRESQDATWHYRWRHTRSGYTPGAYTPWLAARARQIPNTIPEAPKAPLLDATISADPGDGEILISVNADPWIRSVLWEVETDGSWPDLTDGGETCTNLDTDGDADIETGTIPDAGEVARAELWFYDQPGCAGNKVGSLRLSQPSASIGTPALVIETETEGTEDGTEISEASEWYDGHVGIDTPGNFGSWSQIRGADGSTSGQVDDDNSTALVFYQAGTVSTLWADMYRGLFVVQTNSIDPTVELEVGTSVIITPADISSDDFDDSLVMVSADPADPAAFVTEDYPLVGGQKYATEVAIADMTVNVGIDFVLNTAGLAALQAAVKAGLPFIFGLRMYREWADDEPVWVSGNKSQCTVWTSDAPTEAYRPVVNINGDIPTATVVVRITDPGGLGTKIQKRTRIGSAPWPETWDDHIADLSAIRPYENDGVLTSFPIVISIVASPLSFVQARLVYVVGGETFYSSLCTSMGFDTGARPDLVVSAVLDVNNEASCGVEGDSDTKAIRVGFVVGVNPTPLTKVDVRLRIAVKGTIFSATDLKTLYEDLPGLPEPGEKFIAFVLGYNEFPVTGAALESTSLYSDEVTRPGEQAPGSPTIDSQDLTVVDGGEGGDLDYTVEQTNSNVLDGTHEILVEVVATEFPVESFATTTDTSPVASPTSNLTVVGEGGLGVETGYRADLTLRATADPDTVLDFKQAYYFFDQPAIPLDLTVNARPDTGSATDDQFVTLDTTPGAAKDSTSHEIYMALATMAGDPVANGTKAAEEPVTFPETVNAFDLLGGGVVGNTQIFAQVRGVSYAGAGNFSSEESGYTHLTSPANFQALRDTDGCDEVPKEDWFGFTWSNDNDGGDARDSDPFDIDYSIIVSPNPADDGDWSGGNGGSVVSSLTAGLELYDWENTGVPANTITAFRIRYHSESTYAVDSSLGPGCPS